MFERMYVDTSSLQLFRVAIWGFVILKNFSEIHELHRLVRFVYSLAFARIFHVIVYAFFFSFKCHRYFLSCVIFSFLNDIFWFRHLVLNAVAVRPTYVSVFSPFCDGSLIHNFFPQAFTFQCVGSYSSCSEEKSPMVPNPDPKQYWNNWKNDMSLFSATNQERPSEQLLHNWNGPSYLFLQLPIFWGLLLFRLCGCR